MHWTKERPTKPGFYFLRFPIEPLPFDGATVAPISFHKIIVVEALKYAEMQFWQGPIHHVDLDAETEFAGPIPMPEEP